MFLNSLKLTAFRNYQELEFQFKKPITVLIGNNAQGKTNFLESIHFLATAKSLRAEKEEELIKRGESFLRVEGETKDETSLAIFAQSTEEGQVKRVKVNGVPRRVTDYASHLAVVLFAPEDVNLVTGSPSLRRNFLDTTISQVDREYKRALSSYENLITKKNKVLKRIREGEGKVDELTFWLTEQLKLGEILVTKRRSFFKFINSIEKKLGQVSYEYIASSISHERLKEYLDREIASASSLIGPHRDDFVFLAEERDLAKFGSRGEQRTAVLDLKFSEVVFIEKTLGDRPILLLDDIFSELDDNHRQHVIDISNLQQTIISTVEWDTYLETNLKQADFYTVEDGVIKKK